MNNLMALVLAFSAGVLMSVQPLINARLGRRTGLFESAFISFLVGTVALVIIIIFFGQGDLGAARGLPWYLFTGGLIGVFVVTTMIVVIPRVGSGIGMIAVLTGQMLMATLIDYFGLLGVPSVSIGPARIIGLLLLFVSMRLIVGKI
jgi:bacterial/archaeal transporter family-2 protein